VGGRAPIGIRNNSLKSVQIPAHLMPKDRSVLWRTWFNSTGFRQFVTLEPPADHDPNAVFTSRSLPAYSDPE
jgi:hypothetical protein